MIGYLLVSNVQTSVTFDKSMTDHDESISNRDTSTINHDLS